LGHTSSPARGRYPGPVLPVARIVPDEVPAAEITERLLDLSARVNHERTVARDWLAKRPRRGEQEPTPPAPAEA